MLGGDFRTGEREMRGLYFRRKKFACLGCRESERAREFRGTGENGFMRKRHNSRCFVGKVY